MLETILFLWRQKTLGVESMHTHGKSIQNMGSERKKWEAQYRPVRNTNQNKEQLIYFVIWVLPGS